MVVNNQKDIFMKKVVCLLVLGICCSAFMKKAERDTLQEVKVIRLGSLFELGIKSFHCEDFYDSCGHYQHSIKNPELLKRLEAYRRSATTVVPEGYTYALPPHNTADGKMYFYYKSGKVDSMCFDGDYLYLNNTPMAVPSQRYFELYYMLDSL